MKVRDRDYVKTHGGWFFCAVGDLHPPDKIIAYPKYVPGPGPWKANGIAYERVLKAYTMPQLAKSIRRLKETEERHVYFDNLLGTEMSCVHAEDVHEHFKPRERTNNLFLGGSPDELETKLLDLVKLLSTEARVDRKHFGVTGSILIGIHQDFSDLDVLIYGRENFCRVLQELPRLYREQRVTKIRGTHLENWMNRRLKNYPMNQDDLNKILERTLTRGIFKDTPFSLHAVRLEEEIEESYGDWRYTGLGLDTIKATVSGSRDGGFMPAVYELTDCLSDKPVSREITKLVSYDGTFASIFVEGDRIQALGKIEKAISVGRHDQYHRILIGSFDASGTDYVKLA